MTDFTELFKELDQREDEGKRFYHEIILNEEYKQARERDVIIDLGSNLGDFSYYMYDRAKVIYAIEANKDNYELLKYYVEKYNLTKIKPFHLAIAGANGERNLYAHMGCGGYALDGTSDNIVHIVTAKTLNTFIVENNIKHIDVLKIDVEGAEDEIFNAPDFIEAAKKIDFIIGENHGKNIKEPLEKNGFRYSANGLNFLAKKYE